MSLSYIAEGATIAEGVLSTIRTAHAFGIQNELAKIYDRRVDAARKTDLRSSIANGIGLGLYFFLTYAAYALGKCFLHS
jgi:ATP-binding cassette subfamily B (MDR/TAP) protein 1